MKKRLLIGFIVLLALELLVNIALFLVSNGKAKITELLLLFAISIFVYWFLNLAAYGFRKVGTLTIFLIFFSFVSIACIIGAIFVAKESGFDPVWAVIIPFPIITISWIVAEYKGEE